MFSLKRKKKQILLLCPYPEGVAPGQRLKYEQYFDFLRAQGYSITVSPFFSQGTWRILYLRGNYARKAAGVLGGYLRRLFDLCRTPFFDGTYIFLHAAPFGGAGLESLFRRFSRRLIYDIDDLVYLGPSSKVNRVAARWKNPRKYSFLMEKADHVITCTPYLDAHVRMFNDRTTDISSTIRTDAYRPVNRYLNDHPLVIGWSGSHSTVPYLKLLEGVFQKLALTDRFVVKVIGTEEFVIPGVEVKCRKWTEASEVSELQEIDIGVYPLPEEEWVLGKSGLKALQYMALGIPTVATAIGANFRVIENGRSGFLVKTEEEWLATLRELLRNAPLRKRLGEEARSRVEQLYSVQANQPIYLSVFERVFRMEERP